MLVVIDDDPTGAQAEAGVPMLLAWTEPLLNDAARARPRALHLLTNSRALERADAYRVVREAAEAAVATLPDAELVLRGDSTLRGHVDEEYRALRDGAFDGADAALMLVPALPAAGRMTLHGVHRIARNGESQPLHETEYARDGGFSYRSSRLLEWAEERSAGYFRAAHGQELHLAELRAGGPGAVAQALSDTAARAPAVFAPDACSDDDLDVIAAGLRCTRANGTRVIVRCAPAFVARLAGSAAAGFTPAPRAERGLLVACGSYVPTSTEQLRRLDERRPGRLVEVRTEALAAVDGHRDDAIEEAVSTATRLIDEGGLAVVATSRAPDTRGLAYSERIAEGLARVVARLRSRVDIVLSKGGITSAINLRRGLGAESAQVIGPVAPGISLWHVTTPEGAAMSYVVFPGNVGDDDALVDVVDLLAPF
jgi:uncharacterized protein YgbK (DUF1537 family)